MRSMVEGAAADTRPTNKSLPQIRLTCSRPKPPSTGAFSFPRTNLSPPSLTHARFTSFRTCCAVATNGRCGTPDGGEVAPLPMDKDDLDPAHPRVGCSARLRAGASIANGSYVAQAVLSSESPGYMGRGRSPKPSPTNGIEADFAPCRTSIPGARQWRPAATPAFLSRNAGEGTTRSVVEGADTACSNGTAPITPVVSHPPIR